MFSFDVFEEGTPLARQILGFLIHNIPSFVLIALLIIAWRWELIGGILIALIGLLFVPFIYMHNYSMNNSVGMTLGIVATINLPFIIVGGLFILSHYLVHRRHAAE